MNEIISKLEDEHSLSIEEYAYLIDHRTQEISDDLARSASRVRNHVYGHDIFVRGLIEFSNICKNDCYYCGIRRSNKNVARYRLTKADILECCKEGYELGFRTFVLQGGEDGYFTDDIMVDIVQTITSNYPDCAITLSLGERSKESYQRLFDAGARRYLLRHETANPKHYAKLHPGDMSYEHRMQCLQDLREVGFQVGAGFMVQSPYQTTMDLAHDLKFIEEFKPEMCGIGPYITQKDTPFKNMESGTLELTLYLLSIIRLIHPSVLLPATTALGTIDPNGREKGVLHGANVIMPNLSPVSVRRKYMLYDNKICTGDESAQCRSCLDRRMSSIGFHVLSDKGDPRPWG